MTYYNENDEYPAQWLRNLWPSARVDSRSIKDVVPADVAEFPRAHFFAGVGGWEYALELAGWPADRAVWTGSCPCQPFSCAGKRKGNADDRHLWPEFRRLIAQCRPATIFGEQVASADGREWLAGVRADLEALGYAVGAADLCAAGVGSPQIRQRLFWVAHAGSQRKGRSECGPGESVSQAALRASNQPRGSSSAGGLEYASGDGRQQWGPESGGRLTALRCWEDALPIGCADGKTRRISSKPELFPLVARIPGRVGKLRAYGNAIVPQVAAVFIRAFLEGE